MKTNFKLKGISLGEIKVEEVHVELDFSVAEAIAMKDLAINTAMEVVDMAPSFLEKVSEAVKKYDSLSKEINKNLNNLTMQEQEEIYYKELFSKMIQEIKSFKSISELESYKIVVHNAGLDDEYKHILMKTINETIEEKERLCVRRIYKTDL